MHNVHDNVLSAIGNIPLVKLNSVTRGLKANVYAKLEFMNPGASVKDRIAMQIIEDAEQSGALKPGGTIVEATSGNTGMGLAIAAALKGYRCIFVLPDKQSEEKRATLRAMGAKVVVTPTEVSPDDPRSYYKTAERIVAETPGSFYANQYHNPSNPKAHYRMTGPELYEQLDGKLDVFIAGLGTGGTISGTGRYLKEQSEDIRIIGVDPVGSLYYDYFHTGRLTDAFSYVVEGIGEDFLPTTMDFTYVDDIVRVSDKECFQMTRRLAREEGLFCGGSCGAAVAGAVKYLKNHDEEGLNVVILLPDSGSRYLSKIYNDNWLEENGFLEPSVGLGTIQDVLQAIGERETKTIPDTLRITEAIGLMKMHGISQLPVLKGEGVVGILHENTILQHALNTSGTIVRAGEVADTNYCTVTPHTEVSVVVALLTKVRIALVMDDDSLTGVITRIDIIDHVARATAETAGANRT